MKGLARRYRVALGAAARCAGELTAGLVAATIRLPTVALAASL